MFLFNVNNILHGLQVFKQNISFRGVWEEYFWMSLKLVSVANSWRSSLDIIRIYWLRLHVNVQSTLPKLSHVFTNIGFWLFSKNATLPCFLPTSAFSASVYSFTCRSMSVSILFWAAWKAAEIVYQTNCLMGVVGILWDVFLDPQFFR